MRCVIKFLPGVPIQKTDASDTVIGQVSKTSIKPVTDVAKDALVSAENGESNGDDSPPEGGVAKDEEEAMEVDKGEGKTDRGKDHIPKENGKGDAALNGRPISCKQTNILLSPPFSESVGTVKSHLAVCPSQKL